MNGPPNILRAARESAGLTITEAARRAEMSKVTLYKVEGGSDALVSTLRRLARVYDVPVERLVEGAASA